MDENKNRSQGSRSALGFHPKYHSHHFSRFCLLLHLSLASYFLQLFSLNIFLSQFLSPIFIWHFSLFALLSICFTPSFFHVLSFSLSISNMGAGEEQHTHNLKSTYEVRILYKILILFLLKIFPILSLSPFVCMLMFLFILFMSIYVYIYYIYSCLYFSMSVFFVCFFYISLC